jgi:hypothetical protein
MWIWRTKDVSDLWERYKDFTRCYSKETNLPCPLAEINKMLENFWSEVINFFICDEGDF